MTAGISLSLVATLAILAAPAARAADRSLEFAVKATFLFKFASYVEWPPGAFAHPGAPFVLCIAGDDPYGGAIEEAVRGQSIGRRAIVLRRTMEIPDGAACHAVFVSGSRRQSVERILAALRGTATLTVTDEAISHESGVIHFAIVDDRVSFDIDLDAATRQRLSISAKLLSLARRVRGGPGDGRR